MSELNIEDSILSGSRPLSPISSSIYEHELYSHGIRIEWSQGQRSEEKTDPATLIRPRRIMYLRIKILRIRWKHHLRWAP
jgi:hypothetical protein